MKRIQFDFSKICCLSSKVKFLFSVLLMICCIQLIAQQDPSTLKQTKTNFVTSDSTLQLLYNKATTEAAKNIRQFGKYKVMIEGAVWQDVYIETQPMGGYMYSRYDTEIAKNNSEIFMDYQREDGRFPGSIANSKNVIKPNFKTLQGLCMPKPAFEIYFWLGKDKSFLTKLYNSLEKYDDYLWKNRDSDHNGCLETWCVWDTGEDNSSRFSNYPLAWSYDYPPTLDKIKVVGEGELSFPVESMDAMSYSYTCRDVLSLISKELVNGKESYWRNKANEVKSKIKSYLWVPEKHAAFDYDKNNNRMDILTHNNLRCMYFGSFDQEMADQFVRYHLLNTKEFFTPMPLPSIATNDSHFKNSNLNSWGGPPQSLTFQRSISALENYGHFAELTLIGEKFLKAVSDSMRFTQQFDTFKGTVNTLNMNGAYGPAVLTTLELFSRFYGVHFSQDKLYWSSLKRGNDKNAYTLSVVGNSVSMENNQGQVNCFINNRKVISYTQGVRVVTDLKGNLVEVVGIDYKPVTTKITYQNKVYQLNVEPNTIYKMDKAMTKFKKSSAVEFSGIPK